MLPVYRIKLRIFPVLIVDENSIEKIRIAVITSAPKRLIKSVDS